MAVVKRRLLFLQKGPDWSQVQLPTLSEHPCNNSAHSSAQHLTLCLARAGSENLVNMPSREPMAVVGSSDNVGLDDKWIERDFVSQGKIRSHPRVQPVLVRPPHAQRK